MTYSHIGKANVNSNLRTFLTTVNSHSEIFNMNASNTSVEAPAPIDMNSYKITNLGAPSAASDAVRLQDLASDIFEQATIADPCGILENVDVVQQKLVTPRALNMHTKQIYSLGAPTCDASAARLQDVNDAKYLSYSEIALFQNGSLITDGSGIEITYPWKSSNTLNIYRISPQYHLDMEGRDVYLGNLISGGNVIMVHHDSDAYPWRKGINLTTICEQSQQIIESYSNNYTYLIEGSQIAALNDTFTNYDPTSSVDNQTHFNYSSKDAWKALSSNYYIWYAAGGDAIANMGDGWYVSAGTHSADGTVTPDTSAGYAFAPVASEYFSNGAGTGWGTNPVKVDYVYDDVLSTFYRWKREDNRNQWANYPIARFFQMFAGWSTASGNGGGDFSRTHTYPYPKYDAAKDFIYLRRQDIGYPRWVFRKAKSENIGSHDYELMNGDIVGAFEFWSSFTNPSSVKRWGLCGLMQVGVIDNVRGQSNADTGTSFSTTYPASSDPRYESVDYSQVPNTLHTYFGFNASPGVTRGLGMVLTSDRRLTIGHVANYDFDFGPDSARFYDTFTGHYLDDSGWLTASKKVLKESIQTLDTKQSFDLVDGLKPVEFDLRPPKYKTINTNGEEVEVQTHKRKVHARGFVVEELPGEFTENGNRAAYSINDIVSTLTAAFQEAKKKIAKLEQEVENLKKDRNNS